MKLWSQQIKALIIKRILIFKRRYILALVTLFLPLVLEAIIDAIIPAGTNISSSLTGRPSTLSGTNNLSITNYNAYSMLYSLDGDVDYTKFQNVLDNFYTNSNRPGISLERVPYGDYRPPLFNYPFSNLSSYNLDLRKQKLKNLYGNYYTGMAFYLVNTTQIYADAYYSTFAYNSAGSILSEISNIILAYLNPNNSTKTITTYNTPIPSANTYIGTSFVDYLPCVDTLPYSIINFINSIIISLVISIIVVHVGRERASGSKGLQLLSGTNFVTYWLSNHIFDFIICLFNAATMVAMIKAVNFSKNDSSVEIYSVGGDSQSGFLFLVLLFSIFCWPTIAYIWTFLFQSEIIGFVVLALTLGIIAFVDMVLAFIQLIVQTTATTNGTSTNTPFSIFLNVFRWILAALFPNITIKRAMFNLKISNNSFCISTLNSIIYSIF
jgi:hypothetical protein